MTADEHLAFARSYLEACLSLHNQVSDRRQAMSMAAKHFRQANRKDLAALVEDAVYRGVASAAHAKDILRRLS